MNAKSIFRNLFWAIVAFYTLAIVAYLTWFWGDFDDNVVITLVLFGPRWPYPIPALMVSVILLCLRQWKKMGITLLLAGVTTLTVSGLNISTQTILDSPPAYARYRVMTWNAGGVKSLANFRQFQEETDPDIILIQESPAGIQKSDFPPTWHFQIADGGFTVASKYRIEFVDAVKPFSLPLPGSAAKFRLDTPDGTITLCIVHLPTPRPGIQSAIDTKFRDLKTLSNILAQASLSSAEVRNWVGRNQEMTIVAGDFNMPAEMRNYRRDWGGFSNAYSQSTTGFGGTKQTSWHGTRIDHVLCGPPLKCRNSFVGRDLGSDHRPMVADLMLEE